MRALRAPGPGVAAYLIGAATTRECGEQFGMSASTAARRLRAAGVTLRPTGTWPSATPAGLARLAADYKAGASIDRAAALAGIDPRTAGRRLHALPILGR